LPPTATAKGFLQLALWQVGQFRPRVINVDGHPAYSFAIEQLKRPVELGPRCLCRRAPYLNNILEQDHRFVKKRIMASQWFRSVDVALNTIAGYDEHHPQRSNPLGGQGTMSLARPGLLSARSGLLRNSASRRYLRHYPRPGSP
jgi:transposase-like protein